MQQGLTLMRECLKTITLFAYHAKLMYFLQVIGKILILLIIYIDLLKLGDIFTLVNQRTEDL